MESSFKEVSVLIKRTTPLCYLPSGVLVCYKDGYIILLDNGKQIKRFLLFDSMKERIIGRFRYAFRFLRLGIRAAVALDENNIIISKGNTIFEVNLKEETISNGFYCGDGIRPLIFTESKGVKGIQDGVYFGGYLGNRNKKPVHIYKRTAKDRWEVVYTFPQGDINHVHTIVADKYRECLWIFTGDFGKAAAIWRASSDFKVVERFVCNDQKYRGCVAYAIPEGLLYATDAPFADNFIFLLDINTKVAKPLGELPGSCIYGCKWNDNYVFSSTVEPDGRNTTKWQALFGRKRGSGIKDDYVHVICGNLQHGFKEIFKCKKDGLPYCSFQFGVIRFPYGICTTQSLCFQPVSTVRDDLNTLILECNK